MITAWLMLLLNTVCFPLRLGNTGSFPRPLKAEEEREYLARFAQGDMEARNKGRTGAADAGSGHRRPAHRGGQRVPRPADRAR